VLWQVVSEAINFPVKLVSLSPGLHILELFHGPTLAFKDFGARFMARLMGYFVRGETRPLTVLVATSGDTGSAVAHGFLGVPGIRVVILYPSKRISEAQEKQFTTLDVLSRGGLPAVAGGFGAADCLRAQRKLRQPHGGDFRQTHRVANSEVRCFNER
jgi:threonine synthase